MKSWLSGKNILITGSTSGLGRSLVTRLLNEQAQIISVSRNGKLDYVDNENYIHFSCDLAEFSHIQALVKQLQEREISIDILINNAGVLSPPNYLKTQDGFEYSYQVNFLSQVYLTRILKEKNILNSSLVINVSSPIHTKGTIDLDRALDSNNYSVVKAYSNTKLYMALFSMKLAVECIHSFSFNPGTFSSGIYRRQKKWFHLFYKIAAPFMASSNFVADQLLYIIIEKRWVNGKMMNIKGQISTMLSYEQTEVDSFWTEVNNQLLRFNK